MKTRDYIGLKFGRLTVIERMSLFKSEKRKRVYLRCKCDCGKEKIALAYSLTSGKTTSCGCYNMELVKKEFSEASFNRLYLVYKVNARKRNLYFGLTKEKFKEITRKNCFYCGKPPSQIIKASNDNGDYTYNGIDRADPHRGYTEDNVVPCCGRCNQAKMSETQEDFLEWIRAVYAHSVQV